MAVQRRVPSKRPFVIFLEANRFNSGKFLPLWGHQIRENRQFFPASAPKLASHGRTTSTKCQAKEKTLAVHPASTYYRRKPHEQGFEVVLSSIDRQLLQRCLDREEQAWSEFVDRFLGLVLHVVEHTSGSRGISIPRDLRDDLTAEVFASLIRDDFGILRKFRSQSSLATYLTVVARRIVVRKLQQLKTCHRANGTSHVGSFKPRPRSKSFVRCWRRGRAGSGQTGWQRSSSRSHVLLGREILSGDLEQNRHARKQRRPDAQPRSSQNERDPGPINWVQRNWCRQASVERPVSRRTRRRRTRRNRSAKTAKGPPIFKFKSC